MLFSCIIILLSSEYLSHLLLVFDSPSPDFPCLSVPLYCCFVDPTDSQKYCSPFPLYSVNCSWFLLPSLCQYLQPLLVACINCYSISSTLPSMWPNLSLLYKFLALLSHSCLFCLSKSLPFSSFFYSLWLFSFLDFDSLVYSFSFSSSYSSRCRVQHVFSSCLCKQHSLQYFGVWSYCTLIHLDLHSPVSSSSSVILTLCGYLSIRSTSILIFAQLGLVWFLVAKSVVNGLPTATAIEKISFLVKKIR